jgi:chitinase
MITSSKGAGCSIRLGLKFRYVAQSFWWAVMKNLAPCWLVRAVAPLTALCVTSSAPAAPGGKNPDKVFVGYLFGQPRDVNFRLYTHLCHAFLTADADGKLQQGRSVPSRDLTAAAHQAGVKMILSLGGWGWDRQFASIVSKPEAEERYATAVIAVIDEFDYDGIDFDWEYPDNDKEVPGFERLTRRFRKELDAIGARKGRPMFLTMAASSNPGTLQWLDKAFLLENLNWINVMTYDFTGNWTNYAGHHSPLFASSKQTEGARRSTELTMKHLLEERGLPADRLAVGIPLYGRGFGVKEPYASTNDQTKGRAPRGGGYREILRLQKDQGWTRLWDDETKNPWLLAPDRSAVICYDDPESVALKTEWAMKQGFRGVFFWQINQDRLADGSNPLQEASLKKWEEAAGKGR